MHKLSVNAKLGRLFLLALFEDTVNTIFHQSGGAAGKGFLMQIKEASAELTDGMREDTLHRLKISTRKSYSKYKSTGLGVQIPIYDCIGTVNTVRCLLAKGDLGVADGEEFFVTIYAMFQLVDGYTETVRLGHIQAVQDNLTKHIKETRMVFC